MSGKRVRQAVIVAAGHGSRLRPITRAIPKEMLPIGRKPLLEHVVEEMRGAGMERILLVISPDKEMIRRYFGDGSEWRVEIEYVIQPAMRGLGDAVLCGGERAEGEPFLAAFGDCIVGPGCGPAARLSAAHTAHGSMGTALCEDVPPERVRHYGILAPGPDGFDDDGSFRVVDMVEKPDPNRAPSRWAVAARWVLGAEAIPYLRRIQPKANGECCLTDAIAAMAADGLPLRGTPLAGAERRLDIGRWESYLPAAAVAALDDEEAGDRVRQAVAERLSLA